MKKYLIPILILIAAWVYADDPFAPGGSKLGTALTGVVLDSEIDSAANLESQANLGEFASNILAATSAANARSINGSAQVQDIQTFSVADSGDGNAATGNLTPDAAEVGYIAGTCSDADTCAVTMIESSATHGDRFAFMNVSANNFTFAWSDTVFHNGGESGSVLTVKQYGSFEAVYETDRWVRVDASATEFFESIQITGILSGGARTPVTADADDFATAFVGDNLYGGTFIANGTGTAQLPVMAVGMNFCVITLGDIEVIVDTNGADGYLKDGITGAEGKNITNKSDAGDIACFQYYDADDWLITTGSETTPFVWAAEAE